MPISGLVVVFGGGQDQMDDTITRLANHPSIDVGQKSSNRLAIVIDSESREQDIEINAWVRGLPGVADLQIAFVGFDDEPTPSSKPAQP
ncbi:hypothetical protein Pla175_31920 [Pirellulimonas nuda]|uniref:Uncharacterized protein n=1 Tax=Pirellulimonas nuda TaxID=2528009 RepID=A0A518DEA0_9BACT|nr:hypothetical protein Pla175_31920 [Pirellulimonas nuda]